MRARSLVIPNADLRSFIRIGTLCALPDAFAFASDLMGAAPESFDGNAGVWLARERELIAAAALYFAMQPFARYRRVARLEALFSYNPRMSTNERLEEIRRALTSLLGRLISCGHRNRTARSFILAQITTHLERHRNESESVIACLGHTFEGRYVPMERIAS